MSKRIAVLLINIGTPNSPETPDVRRFMREFLSDRRVVDTNRLLWGLILNGAILPTRPRKVSKLYSSIWTEQGAPMLVKGRSLCEKLSSVLNQRMDVDVDVALGMTYGQPSVADALAKLRASEAEMLLVLPLFPQYSATTTAAAFDAVTRELRTWRSMPHFHFIRGYWNNPVYLGALEQSIRQHWKKVGPSDHLIMSYHGLPLRYVEAGDPYMRHCDETTRLLTEAFENNGKTMSIAFQSRFGRAPWLTPYTDLELIRLAEQKMDTVDIVCPGFAVDCLETLHEITVEGNKLFKEHGGKTLRYIPALNDSDHHAAALADVALSHLA